jgi:integrase
MPRRAKGARLYLDPTRKEWVIRDGSGFVRTGRRKGDRGNAEKDLGEYIGRKHKPTPSASPLIDDVLTAYGQEHGPHTSRPRELAGQIGRLLAFWSGKRVGDVTARSCRGYAVGRTSAAGRRDLEVLRAAIRYWHREYGPLPSVPAVVLPPKSEPRERWLTRSEAARLLWAARRVEHLKRFILIGLYTGSRSGAILALRWDWVDLEQGIMRRRGVGEGESRKRRPPVRLGARLLSHMRRWQHLDHPGRADAVIQYDGLPVRKLRRSWAGAVRRAGLDPDVTPHTLRHTRATWLMQNGVPIWQAAGSLGMTVEMLERVYGKHHPDWQREAAEV